MKAGILLGQLDNAGNEASLIRTAEAFGINHVHLCGEKPPEGPSCGAENHVTFTRHDDYQAFCGYAKDNNYSIVAIENKPAATPVDSVEYPVNPIFVVGHEKLGVPETVMVHAGTVVDIPQSPNSYVQCLNASVAGSMVIQDWFSKL